ncbi:MAG: hypothetical protein JWM14_2289 [Chitinophagaceae bacterium]|nr:hypothetical protein [Chitinophagaceae bacterium]
MLRSIAGIVLGLICFQATAQNDPTLQKTPSTRPMKTLSNKETIRKLYEECLNKRNYNLLNDIVSADYTGVRGEKGPVGLENTVKPLIEAFPDIQWKIEDLLEDSDKVVVRWVWQGTHQNSFQGISATNKAVKNEAIAIYQFKNNKVVSVSMQSDRLGFLIQTGVLSPDIIPGAVPKK